LRLTPDQIAAIDAWIAANAVSVQGSLREAGGRA
jgi:hypothetical protein